MQLSACTSNLTQAGANCLIVFIDQNSNLVSDFSEELGPFIEEALNSGALGNTNGEQLICPLANNDIANALLLYRLPKQDLSAEKVREMANKLAPKLNTLNFSTVGIDLSALQTTDKNTNIALELGIATILSNYRFEAFKSKKCPERKLQKLVFIGTDNTLIDTASKAQILGESICVARDLGNMPGNACTPLYLSEKAQNMENELGIKTTILGEEEMSELGMGSLLSVSAGSVEPAQLIVMEYRGADDDAEAPYALVGKGITFDTGGISLKPGAAMDEMKFDMCGAASVFGAITAVAQLKLPVNLVAIVAAAENMPSGHATKPGDIVTSMAGKTIEVLNTDAEGRLVLCDALTYAAQFKPKTIVDIATLTGACVIALGSHASGLYANDDELGEALIKSSIETGDKAWRMPLWPEYDKQLESNFADIANIGGREAGSVTAACFLSRFTKDQKWAHLDIAGTAWKSGKAKGATGRPVRLLVDYLENCSKTALSSLKAT